MTIDDFRQLLALRYTAESVEEVNKFLADAFKLQIGLQKQSIWDRLVSYLGGAIAVFVVIEAMEANLFLPGVALLIFIVAAVVRACVNWKAIEKQNQELTSTENTARGYWKKVSRDRLENRTSMAIQNRKAAAMLLKGGKPLDPDDEQLLKDNVLYWGARIKECEGMLDDSNKDNIWEGHGEKLQKIRKWIEAEQKARPIAT